MSKTVLWSVIALGVMVTSGAWAQGSSCAAMDRYNSESRRINQVNQEKYKRLIGVDFKDKDVFQIPKDCKGAIELLTWRLQIGPEVQRLYDEALSQCPGVKGNTGSPARMMEISQRELDEAMKRCPDTDLARRDRGNGHARRLPRRSTPRSSGPDGDL